MAVLRPPQPGDGIGQVELGVERVATDVGDFGRQLGASRRERKPTEHALIDEAQPRLAVGEGEDDSGVGHQRRVRSSEPELPTHAQVSQDCVAVGEWQPQILAAPARLGECPPGGLQLEVFGPGEVPTYWPWMKYVYPNDLAPGDAVRETAAYDLDLRKLGHRSRAGVLRRREGRCFSSLSDDEVDGLQSAIAASGVSNQTRSRSAGCDRTGSAAALQRGEGNGCGILLGFLLVPASTGSIALISILTMAWNVLAWSGPDSTTS